MQEDAKKLFETVQGLHACPSLGASPVTERKFFVSGYFKPGTSAVHDMADLGEIAQSTDMQKKMLANHIEWLVARNLDHNTITTLTYQGKVYVKVVSVQTRTETYYEWDQDRYYDPGRQVTETTRSVHYFPPKDAAGFNFTQLDWKDPGLHTEGVNP